MKISAVVCTYNGEKYLEEQLLSILRQSTTVDEIIICDDNSKDNTLSVIHRLKNIYPNIQLFVNETNLGVAKNFYNAINRCTGDIVFLSDQDDVWHPQKVEIMTQKMLSENVKVLFSDAELVDENNQSLNTSLFETTGFNRKKHYLNSVNGRVLVFFENRIVSGATMSINREFVTKKIQFPPDDFVLHDGWIASYASIYNEISYTNEKLLRYRQHAGNVIGGINTNTQQKTSLKAVIEKNIITIEHFLKYCGITNENDLKSLKIHLRLLRRLSERRNNFFSRLTSFSFLYLWYKVNEFYTLRLFLGNWKNYIFRKQ